MWYNLLKKIKEPSANTQESKRIFLALDLKNININRTTHI